jgi:hypothetical protein
MRFRIMSNNPTTGSVRKMASGSGVVTKTPLAPLENDAICRSNVSPLPQVKFFHVIASPPLMALIEHVVDPEPGPLP